MNMVSLHQRQTSYLLIFWTLKGYKVKEHIMQWLRLTGSTQPHIIFSLEVKALTKRLTWNSPAQVVLCWTCYVHGRWCCTVPPRSHCSTFDGSRESHWWLCTLQPQYESSRLGMKTTWGNYTLAIFKIKTSA